MLMGAARKAYLLPAAEAGVQVVLLEETVCREYGLDAN